VRERGRSHGMCNRQTGGLLHYLRGASPEAFPRVAGSIQGHWDRNGEVAPPILEKAVAPAHIHNVVGPAWGTWGR
jgi:hypothetical protein